MAVFESKVNIDKPISEVYHFLSDFNNHERLMPDNITNWSSTINKASFSIKNLGNLSLQISNKIENQTIIILPASETPFNVEMRWVLADLGDNTTEAILTVTAELNMMLKMLASGPLKKLVEYQTEALRKLL